MEKNKHKKENLILCLFLCFVLTTAMQVCILDAADYPESGKTVRLVGKGNALDGIQDQDYIWFGTKDEGNYFWTDEDPYWRVLDADRMNNGNTGMFLLSEGLIADNVDNKMVPIKFAFASPSVSHKWQGSNAQKWCGTFLANVFSEGERDAIAMTTISDSPYVHYNDGIEWPWTFDVYDKPEKNYLEHILDQDRVFFLSAKEAASSAYGLGTEESRRAYFMDGLNFWWLRSPSKLSSDIAGVVTTMGLLNDDMVYASYYARPAFNLNMNALLFSTKVSSDPDTYKLTVKDKKLRIAIADGKELVKEGDFITAPYTVSGEHANEQTRAIVLITDRPYTDSDAEIKYYGELGEDGSIILEDDSWYVYLLAENRNGVRKTDYASEPLQIYPHVHIWQEATCTTPRICSLCHETEGMPAGHRWKEATCTEPETCMVCHVTKGQAAGHDWGGWAVIKKPTAVSLGEERRICRNDSSHVEKRIIPAEAAVGETVEDANGKNGQVVTIAALATGKSAGKVVYTKAPNRKSVTVPGIVKISGKTYVVTAIGKHAFIGKNIRTITIGANVKKIARYAFRKSKARKLIIRSRNLAKKRVEGCLKGSGIKIIQIKVGSKKLNKKYVKKYKKYFTKKNAGKAVTIK